MFSYSQSRTIGLVERNDEVSDSYFTYSPMLGTKVYLLDNCGYKVNEWETNYRPGTSDFLDSNGDLYTARMLGENFGIGAGGQGGIFQKYSWEGDLIWEYIVSDSFQLAHHEFKILPNGNLIAIVWDNKTKEEAIQAGRDSLHLGVSLWSEKIIEFKPILPDSAEIVWEWKVWDHLIQDFDNSKDNFGSVIDNPRKFNVNFPPTSALDWIHFNSIEYNETLDQLVLSSVETDEIYIIDHSTTIQEAATSSGGRWGHGGDILFRWGNPNAYNQTHDVPQYFYGQHDARWIENTVPGTLGISVFNNGNGRPVENLGENYSDVIHLIPSWDLDSNYILTNNDFSVDLYDTIFNKEQDISFYAPITSGSTVLPNNEILVSNGPTGRFKIVNTQEDVLWDYIVPIGSGANPANQGTPPSQFETAGITNLNFIFKAVHYSADFPGFIGKDLSSEDFVEITTLESICDTVDIPSATNELNSSKVEVYPTILSQNSVNIQLTREMQGVILNLIDINGKIYYQNTVSLGIGTNQVQFSSDLPKGMYLFQIKDVSNGEIRNYTQKLVKL